MKAFVAGATGETGRRIVRTGQSEYSRPRFGARLRKARAILPESAELVVGDVLKPDLSAAIGDSTVLLHWFPTRF